MRGDIYLFYLSKFRASQLGLFNWLNKMFSPWGLTSIPKPQVSSKYGLHLERLQRPIITKDELDMQGTQAWLCHVWHPSDLWLLLLQGFTVDRVLKKGLCPLAACTALSIHLTYRSNACSYTWFIYASDRRSACFRLRLRLRMLKKFLRRICADEAHLSMTT